MTAAWTDLGITIIGLIALTNLVRAQEALQQVQADFAHAACVSMLGADSVANRFRAALYREVMYLIEQGVAEHRRRGRCHELGPGLRCGVMSARACRGTSAAAQVGSGSSWITSSRQ